MRIVYLGPGVGPFFLLIRLGFPYNPLKTKKGTLFIPRLLPGLVIKFSGTQVEVLGFSRDLEVRV